MQYATVVSDQFQWKGDTLVHIPTGAWFKWSYPNSDSYDLNFSWGAAGDVLPNGDDYEREEIKRMALVLLEGRRERR
jgi:hypothetical protein